MGAKLRYEQATGKMRAREERRGESIAYELMITMITMLDDCKRYVVMTIQGGMGSIVTARTQVGLDASG